MSDIIDLHQYDLVFSVANLFKSACCPGNEVGDLMRKFLMSCAVVSAAFALSAVEPVDAFVRAQPDIAKATSATSSFIEVKFLATNPVTFSLQEG